MHDPTPSVPALAGDAGGSDDHDPYAALDLLPQHRDQLLASAISGPVAVARGYRSVTVKAALARLGFGVNQRRVPGLLLPVHSTAKTIPFHQLRADDPRLKKGKPLKYETPFGVHMALDAPPLIWHLLGDPTIPLWITEGIRKDDAGVSLGLCCIGIIGVWNWRGRNADDGLTALPDWELIALNGRDVYLAFDSDQMSNPHVAAALTRLAAFLKLRGAHVHIVYLPPTPDGRKVGLDDAIAGGMTVADLLALAADGLRDLPRGAFADRPRYSATDAGFIYHQTTTNGTVDVLLSNFTATLIEEVIADDGVSERAEVVIEGECEGRRLPPLRVLTRRFNAMEWPSGWGLGPRISAGMGARDRVREATQYCSPPVPRRRVIAHPGYRDLPGHGWCYLHAAGAIGAAGAIPDVDVALSGPAARLVLPEPPTGKRLVACVRASLALLDLAPARITAPLLGATYRAPLCAILPADVSPYYVGPTGVYKSELTALGMQHYGAGFDRLNLPAVWSSTANALERLAFDFKDALLVVDDFAPTGTAVEVARLHATADRVLRGAGNRSSRSRMAADGSLRPDYPPQGIIVSSGEDVPRGHSLRARLWITEVGPDDVRLPALAMAQEAAARGVLAEAMAGYVHWLAPHMADLPATLPAAFVAERAAARGSGTHARTPEAVAHFVLGWQTWLHFALALDAITADEAETLMQRVWDALGEGAAMQAREQGDEEPARRFLDLLASALIAGQAHLAATDGSFPGREAATWGWRVRNEDDHIPRWDAKGDRVGWVEGDDVYLDLTAALAVVQRLGERTGGGISVSGKTLAKRLHDRGYLHTPEPDRLTVRHMLQGARRHVYHLARETLTSGKSGQSGQSGQTSDDSASARGLTARIGPIFWPDFPPTPAESGQKIGPLSASPRANGPIGPIGPASRARPPARKNDDM